MSTRVAAAVLACALGLGAAWALGLAQPVHAQDPPPLAVTPELPDWAAPSTFLRVRGTAAPDATVALWVGERRRARTAATAEGRFSFRVRVPRVKGRYPIAVVSGEERAEAGRLRVRPLVLAAAGDVTFGDGVAKAIARHGPRWPWRSVAPVLRRADLAVTNLEGAVSARGSPVPKEFTFRGPPRALRAAARFAGIDVVSVANNHSLDYGRLAFRDTLRHARRFGIKPVGGGANLERARRPAILTRGGLRVAFLGYSDVRPPGFDAGPSLSGATPAFPELIRADVRAARKRADVVVAYFHWGIELARTPSARQRHLASVALDAGATVVLGTHPHVLQPIEPRRKRLVAWSLGNFVFAAHSPGTERTGILRIRLGARGVEGHGFRRARIAWVQPRLNRPSER